MEIQKISEGEIRSLVGAQSFERGYNYFKNNSIFNSVLQGKGLKAYCQGSQDLPYWVRIDFSGKVIKGHCTCPVGNSGQCKHVAALLLTWLHRPSEFKEIEEFDKAMERRSKEELIDFIEQALKRHPELEQLLELHATKADREDQPKVDAEAYHRQAALAFNTLSRSYSWGIEEAIASQLEVIVDNGDKFVKQSDYANAAAVYQAVAQEILDNYEMLEDNEGDLGSVVNRCVEGLGRCLALSKNNSVRKQVLNTLFSVYKFDVDFGGVGLGDGVPEIIIKHTTPEEQKTVAEWVRKALPQNTKEESDRWHMQEYGGFLLQLEKRNIDTEAFLRICRETGRLGDIIGKLLALKRTGEAVEEAKKAGDFELLELADIFVSHKHSQTARELMEERAKTTHDTRILEWLKEFYKKSGEIQLALEISRKLFSTGNSMFDHTLSNYKDIRSLAKKLNVWKEVRKELLSDMTGKKEYGLLTRIYLDENCIEEALETVKNIVPYSFSDTDLLPDVARAAEKTNPEAAIDIYRQLVEDLVKSGGRNNYKQACNFLGHIQRIYKNLGETKKWDEYISELREQNRTRRSLQEELANSGL